MGDKRHDESTPTTSPEAIDGPLFYAYARRTDSTSQSRYLLTFASASVAKKWWSLVQQEFPDAGVRTGAQLFSFRGDDFPGKPASSSKFDGINTKWFYTQFGDSNNTGGRAQDIIPLQDVDGNVLSGEVSSKEEATADTAAAGIDGAALEKGLQKMQELMEGNATQVKMLTEIQSKNQERMEKIEQLVAENTNHVKALMEGQSANQDRMKDVTEESREQLRQVLLQVAKASDNMTEELKQQRQKSQSPGQSQGAAPAPTPPRSNVNCTHNVHPRPRKIDRPIVGYDYGQKDTTRAKKTLAAKSPAASSANRAISKPTPKEKTEPIQKNRP